MRIKATFHFMPDSEILDMIPQDTLANIKTKSPHPTFKVYNIGHEGKAQGFMVGVGKIIKNWFKSAVHKLHEKIQMGLKLFHGHAETNETENRLPIGEVVGKKLKDIDGRESVLVACWVYPDYKNLPLDIASIEADININNSGDELYVADVDKVTGIALGNSKVNTPGFPGATLLGAFQAFAKENNIDIGLEVESELKLAYKLPDIPGMGIKIEEA